MTHRPGPHRWLGHFARDERGNGTIEFVILLPFFLVLFMSTFELGMALTRQVMLDRGLDMTVRMVRLGQIAPVEHDTLKAAICERAAIIPNCLTELKLEMRPLDPRAWVNIPNRADCIDREDYAIAPREFTPGVMNQLMILRACALFNPYIPTTGLGSENLGSHIPRESADAYALIAMASFVIEPQ